MPREYPRSRRVAEQLQRTLSELLRREVRDPRLRPVTITHVRVSPDFNHAWVSYAVLGGDLHDPLQREILQAAAPHLRGPVGRALGLRVSPQLHFQPDEQLARSARLDDLITRAVREDETRHPDEPADSADSADSADPADPAP